MEAIVPDPIAASCRLFLLDEKAERAMKGILFDEPIAGLVVDFHQNQEDWEYRNEQ